MTAHPDRGGPPDRAGESPADDGHEERDTAELEPVRPRRSRVLIFGVVGLLLAGAAYALWPADGPEAVVEDYLTAVLDGDVTRAMSIVGDESDDLRGDRAAAFLTAEALSDEWAVVGLSLHAWSDSTASVDVALSYRDGPPARGRFTLEFRDGWTILNPYAEFRPTATLTSFLELGGHLEPDAGDDDSTSFLLFPGVYEVNRSASDLMVTPDVLIALPSGHGEPSHDRQVTLTERGREGAREAVKTLIDGCAEEDEPSPADCPFSAEGEPGTVRVGEDLYQDVTDVEWEVESYPVIDVVSTPSGLRVVSPDVGGLRLSGTGTNADNVRGPVGLDCAIDLSVLRVSLDESLRFRATVTGPAAYSC